MKCKKKLIEVIKCALPALSILLVFVVCDLLHTRISSDAYGATVGVVTEVSSADLDEFVIHYSYAVDGTVYYGEGIYDQPVAVGTQIKVVYDSAEPEISAGSLFQYVDNPLSKILL